MAEITASYHDYDRCYIPINRRSTQEEEEIWANHYSSNHQILLVGEGDFSFALSLALSFRSGFNIVASTIDSYDVLINKYKCAKSNLDLLHSLGARLLYNVDARTMNLNVALNLQKFDRIVYNFPHAGFFGKEDDDGVIRIHRNLVCSFFKNASRMLQPNGEIHVSHKTKYPFSSWNIEQLASQSCLTLLDCVDFKQEDYPGYNNKRGDGSRSDEPFHLGECCTFKFVSSSSAKKSTGPYQTYRQEIREIPLQLTNLQRNSCVNRAPVIEGGECFRIFVEYFDHARLTYGQTDCYLLSLVSDHLRSGFERYMAEDRGRRLTGYVDLLVELRGLSKRRIEYLEKRLLEIDGRCCGLQGPVNPFAVR